MICVDVSQRKAYGYEICVNEDWINNEYKKNYFNEYLNDSIDKEALIWEDEWFDIEILIEYICKRN